MVFRKRRIKERTERQALYFCHSETHSSFSHWPFTNFSEYHLYMEFCWRKSLLRKKGLRRVYAESEEGKKKKKNPFAGGDPKTQKTKMESLGTCWSSCGTQLWDVHKGMLTNERSSSSLPWAPFCVTFTVAFSGISTIYVFLITRRRKKRGIAAKTGRNLSRCASVFQM